MLPDRVLNPGPPTYESGALPIALRVRPGNLDLKAISLVEIKDLSWHPLQAKSKLVRGPDPGSDPKTIIISLIPGTISYTPWL